MDESPNQIKELLELYQDALDTPQVGSVVQGKIVQVREDEILVDVGFKCEGVLKTEEVRNEEGNLLIKEGDEVEVLIEHVNLGRGIILLSYKKALQIKAWNDIQKAYAEGKVVPAKVVARIKGGWEVDLGGGLLGFLPTSQVSLKPKRKASILGKTLNVKVIQLNRRRKNIVVSRKVVMQEELERKKKECLASIHEGDIIEGKVKNITDFGAFVDIGGLDGLLHINDLSWGRVNHPSEVLRRGQKVTLKVLSIDDEQEKVSLGLKQLQENPWLTAEEKYPPGKKVTGKVVSLMEFGAFIQLEPGIEGLLHVSELSWTKRIGKPSQVLSIGDSVEVVVINVDAQKQRISLSLRQVEPNPWQQLAIKYRPGDRIKGKVKNITDFGVFVEVMEGVEGLVHISDLSRSKVEHPKEVVEKGQEVEAVIRAIDPERQRVALSMKELMPDEWDRFIEKHEIGDTLTGNVSRITEFGVFVEVAEGVEGLVHITEIYRAPNQRLERMFLPGQEVKIRIVRIDKENRRLGLSMKDVE